MVVRWLARLLLSRTWPRVRTRSQLEFLHDLFVKATFFEVAETDVLSFVRIKQDIGKKLLGEGVDYKKAFGQLLLLAYLRAHFFFFYLDIVTGSQPAKGFCIRILFMLHEEADRIAAATAAKTFVYLLGR